jgi:hypothetical protein
MAPSGENGAGPSSATPFWGLTNSHISVRRTFGDASVLMRHSARQSATNMQARPSRHPDLSVVGGDGFKCFFASIAKVGEVGFHASPEAAAT